MTKQIKRSKSDELHTNILRTFLSRHHNADHSVRVGDRSTEARQAIFMNGSAPGVSRSQIDYSRIRGDPRQPQARFENAVLTGGATCAR